jgi:hypothetical protein
VGEAAADRAAVADGGVPDPRERRREERGALAHERVALGGTLTSERADVEPAAVLADGLELGQPGEIDEGRRRREAQVEQRSEALAPGERLGVAPVARQQRERLLEARRAVVVERRRLQPIVPISNMALSWNGSTRSPPTSRILSIES